MSAKYNLFNFITYNKFEVYKDEGNVTVLNILAGINYLMVV